MTSNIFTFLNFHHRSYIQPVKVFIKYSPMFRMSAVKSTSNGKPAMRGWIIDGYSSTYPYFPVKIQEAADMELEAISSFMEI